MYLFQHGYDSFMFRFVFFSKKLFFRFGFLDTSVIFADQKITKGGIIMLIIDSKDCENIDKALKKYKKKFEKSKVLLQLRARQSFMKPSVERRTQVLKAIYRQKMANGEFEA